MIKTVKELKDFLENVPDDALIYEQLIPKGKRLEAVNVRQDYQDGIIYTIYYEFPDCLQVPLSTEPALDYLKRYYGIE